MHNKKISSLSAGRVSVESVQDCVKKARFGGFYYLFGFVGVILCTPEVRLQSVFTISYLLLFISLLTFREISYRLVAHNAERAVWYFTLFEFAYLLNAALWSAFTLHLLWLVGGLQGGTSAAIVATSGFVVSSTYVLNPHYRAVLLFSLIMLMTPALLIPFLIDGSERWLFSSLYILFYFFLTHLGKTQSQLYWKNIDTNQALKARTEELESARKDALAGSYAKSRFLANMSHEIRSPMNGVLGMTELLMDTKLDEKQRGFLNVISNSGQSLLAIINDILDFSKLEANKMSLKLQPVCLRGLLEEIYHLFESQVKEGAVKLILKLPDCAEFSVMLDPIRIRQILYNLVGNAIKFTQKGEIVISLQCTPAEMKGWLNLRVSVKDTGIGIENSKQALVFSEFEQIETLHSVTGTGLGLSICKRLLDLMGGKISFQSTPGMGSDFYFDLPAQLVETSSETKTVSSLQEKSTESLGLKVLVVEDNLINQMVTQGQLESNGCQVVVAEKAQIAIDKVMTESFDIILMDCDMPEIDGFEATQTIRKWERDENRARAPIIALTAHVLESAKQRCFDSGMDDYLSKPIINEDLKAALLRWNKKVKPVSEYIPQ